MPKNFSSSATNKVDAKGRVSIPAPFRKVLQAEESPVLYLRPDAGGKGVIEGFGQSYMDEMSAMLSKMNPLLPQTRALKRVMVGRARPLPLDETGRIVLPADLRALAGIADSAQFVGAVKTFEIWNPEAYEADDAEMQALAIESFDLLPWGAD